MIIVVAHYKAKPGSTDVIGPALERMAERVLTEETGCRVYHVGQATDNPDDWVLYEVYEDQAALDAHRQSAHFKELILESVVPQLIERIPRSYHLVTPTTVERQQLGRVASNRVADG